MKKESERSIATIMFADIFALTAMPAEMDREEATMLMNETFNLMGKNIENIEGKTVRFTDDCVMATFGVPRAMASPGQSINVRRTLK